MEADRFGIHGKLKKIAAAASSAESIAGTDALTITSAYWWHDLPEGDWRRTSANPWREKSRDRHLLLHVEWEGGKHVQTSDLTALLGTVDRTFYLVGDGERMQVDIRLASVWGNTSGGAELEMIIPAEVYERMKKHISYRLVRREPGAGFSWKVHESAVVRK